MVHSVEIKGKQTIHASAVVNWLKPSEQDLGFGNSLSVWLPDNTEHGGPPFFFCLFREFIPSLHLLISFVMERDI